MSTEKDWEFSEESRKLVKDSMVQRSPSANLSKISPGSTCDHQRGANARHH